MSSQAPEIQAPLLIESKLVVPRARPELLVRERLLSGGLGVVLSGANPKFLALALGAALSLAEADASAATTAQAVVLFTLIGALGVAVPLVLYLSFPARGAALLARGRGWLERHETTVLVCSGSRSA